MLLLQSRIEDNWITDYTARELMIYYLHNMYEIEYGKEKIIGEGITKWSAVSYKSIAKAKRRYLHMTNFLPSSPYKHRIVYT